MRRLFAEGPLARGARVTLDEPTARHVKVLRLPAGAVVELFDGHGRLAQARLAFEAGRPVAEIESVWHAPPPRPLVLLQALAKGDKLDLVVRMATEIGVRAIEVVETAHAVPRPEPKRRERWQRIAREASRQSEQAWTPELSGPTPLLEAARRAPKAAKKLVLAARGAPRPADATGETWLVIGPEGGLDPAEEEALAALGYERWTLPTGILRTETAAAVALGALVG